MVEMQFYAGPEHQPFVLGHGRDAALLIHGFPGTPAELRPLGEQLAAAGLTAQGLLLPGFGPDIARLGESGAAQWLDAARNAWRALRRDHARRVLVGFSMGGALALHLAADDPPDALVLLAPFWTLGSPLFRLLTVLKYVMPSVAPFARADLSQPDVRAELGRVMPGVDLDDPAVQTFVKEQMRLSTRVLDDVRRLGATAYRLAPRVSSPALVLQGTADTTVAPSHTRRLVGRLGGPVSYHEIAGDHGFVKQDAVGHDAFNRHVRAFLAEHRLLDRAVPA